MLEARLSTGLISWSTPDRSFGQDKELTLVLLFPPRRSRCCILLFVLSLAPAQKEELIFSCAPQLMAHSSSSTSESASTSFSSEIELFLEAPSADWQPAVRIRPRHFHEARLVYLLFMSTRTERAILLRDEITIWEAAWGSVAFNHRVLLFSTQQTWLSVALGNCELHRCVATALYLGP